jgi:hypothetical protein
MPETKHVTLETVGNGAAGELFARELALVIENLVDVNADPKAVREVTLKFKFKPDPGRDTVDVNVFASSKIASVRPAHALAYLGHRAGKAVLVEHNPNQGDLFDAKNPKDRITPIR